MFDRDAHRHGRRHIFIKIAVFLIEIVDFIHIDRSRRQRRVPRRDLVHTHGRKALHHVGHISVYDADQDDHRRDADDDPEHGQEGAHFVAPDTF